MKQQDRSSFLLRDFEPSAVRLKRKLRLILSKSLRQDSVGNDKVTLSEFIFYLGFLVIVMIIGPMNRISQDIFNAGKCARRLLVDKLELDTVKTVDEFWTYLDRFNEELYNNVIQSNNTNEWSDNQILFADENFVLGIPRLRQLRVDDSHCRVVKDLSVRPINCYAPYQKSKEYRQEFTTIIGYRYNYTSSNKTAALRLSNIYGPYDTGGFIYHFRPTRLLNGEAILDLKKGAWLDLGTRAIFLELIYFNPNTELLTSVNILFEFLTTGTVEVKDFFYTVPINGYFFGRDEILGIFQILFAICYITFAFYYVGKIAEHRLWFIMSSYWNLYDLCLLVLFTISLYFDIEFLLLLSKTLACFSTSSNDVYKETIDFIQTQIARIDLQAYKTAAMIIRLLRFLPHISILTANLLDVFYKSIRNSIGFLLLFFLVFMSFVFFATFHYGNELYEFHTFALTSYTLIRCTFGQFQYDRAYRVSPKWTPIFYMLYVCVIFFILLNLLVAVVNEAYILGKKERKQMEDDLQEEYIRGTYADTINPLRRSKRPLLQAACIQQINRCLRFFGKKSIDFDDDTGLQTVRTGDDEETSWEDRQTALVNELQTILIDGGYNQDVVETFFHRLSFSDEDLFLFKMEKHKAINVLYEEFKIFNDQYEKLARDWRKTAEKAREQVLTNTVEIEQASTMRQHVNVLDERLKKLQQTLPRALENVVKLYVNRFSTD